MLLDTQKLLYTTSRIPNTPIQNLPTKNYPMSARSHSRIPMLNLKNNFKKTNLFSITLPQKRKFYFSDDEDNEEKREIFENFAKKSKDLNEILQKFKKEQVKSSTNSITTNTTTTVTTNTASSSTLNDSKIASTLIINTCTPTPSNLTNSEEIVINNNPLSRIEEISLNQVINNNSNSSGSNNNSSSNHNNNNHTAKRNSSENNMNNDDQQSHSDPFIMKKESKNLNQHCNTYHQNGEIETSQISKNNKNIKNCNNTIIQVEIDDQLQSIQAMRSPTKSKIKVNTIRTSPQEEKENLSMEMNIQKDFSQDKKKVIDKSEIENFSHPLTMNNTHINSNMSTNNITHVNTQSRINTNSTANENKSKILPSFNITKMSQSQSIAKDVGLFMSPSPKKQALSSSTIITSDKKNKSQNSKNKNNSNKSNNININKSNNSGNNKNKEGKDLTPLKPLKKVKQEEEEENVITVATPLMTTTKEGQEVVKEYQYEKINLAEPSALTIKIKNQNIAGIGDIGDQSLSSIDGEESVDSFIDDIIF